MFDHRKDHASRSRILGVTIALGFIVYFGGCKKAQSAQQINGIDSGDPAAVNMAPVGGSQQQAPPPGAVAQGQSPQNEAQQQAQQYQQNPQQYNQQHAPDPDQYVPPQQNGQPNGQYGAPPPQNGQYGPPPPDGQYDPNQPPQAGDDQAYEPGDENFDQTIDEYADQPPPELPVYEQPPCPDPDYMWTPGYWAWAPAGYYWVPGVWVAAPYAGALWTPGFWGYVGNRWGWHHGFWGLHIGFYGGINYGFGYFGTGFEGGYWRSGHFFYNTSIMRVNAMSIHNTYMRHIAIPHAGNRISYNGGRGGLNVRPNRSEMVAMRERHVGPMGSQMQLHREAANNRGSFFNANHGRPTQVTMNHALAADHGIQAPRAGETNRGGFNGQRNGSTQINRGPQQGGFNNNQERGNMRPGGNVQSGGFGQRNEQAQRPQEQQRNQQFQQQHNEQVQRNQQFQNQQRSEQMRNMQQHEQMQRQPQQHMQMQRAPEQHAQPHMEAPRGGGGEHGGGGGGHRR